LKTLKNKTSPNDFYNTNVAHIAILRDPQHTQVQGPTHGFRQWWTMLKFQNC